MTETDSSSTPLAVFEFIRAEQDFSESESAWVSSACPEWARSAVGGVASAKKLDKQREMNEFLIGVVK